jgi:hydroxyacylglutathione hydrolase
MALIQAVLHLGPLDNDVYVLADRDSLEAALVDVAFEPEQVIEMVRRHGFRVKLLLNTHAHYDHAAGMRTVQEALGGDYWLHPADRFLLDRLSDQGAAFGFPPAEAPDEVHDLTDGQVLTLGEHELSVIHTPGHSPGGVCFRHGDTLWVGDTLFAGSIGRTDLPGGSFEELERSIQTKLFPLGDDLKALPGHGPPTTLGRERRENPFVGEKARLA